VGGVGFGVVGAFGFVVVEWFWRWRGGVVVRGVARWGWGGVVVGGGFGGGGGVAGLVAVVG